ncbi:MAG: hypothetical protein AAGN82_27720 [Myxococcota bacterium]
MGRRLARRDVVVRRDVAVRPAPGGPDDDDDDDAGAGDDAPSVSRDRGASAPPSPSRLRASIERRERPRFPFRDGVAPPFPASARA